MFSYSPNKTENTWSLSHLDGDIKSKRKKCGLLIQTDYGINFNKTLYHGSEIFMFSTLGHDFQGAFNLLTYLHLDEIQHKDKSLEIFKGIFLNVIIEGNLFTQTRMDKT